MCADQTASPEPVRKGKRPIWVPNEFSTTCTACQTPFTTLRRRHHCRSCGYLFCQVCSSKTILLPSTFEYDSPQRVCENCYSSHANQKQTKDKLLEENTMCIHFYLRGEAAFQIESSVPDIGNKHHFNNKIGGRIGKSYFFIKDKENNRKILTIFPAPHLHTIFANEAKRPILFSILTAIQHPFIHPISYLGYMKDKQKLIVVREPLSKGSLKDKIYRSDPFKKPFDEKYNVQGQPLSDKEIQRYGRQILEALAFLKKLKYPFPHLSTGNILIDNKGNCCLSDFEISISGVPACYQPYFKSKDLTKEQFSQLEIVCFGHVLWEMALGFPKGNIPLAEVQDKCPQKIYGLLETIFPRDSGALSTAQELLSSKFFAGENVQYTEVQFDKKSKTVLKQARDLLRASLGVQVEKITRTASADTLPSEQPAKIVRSSSSDSKPQVAVSKPSTTTTSPPIKKSASQVQVSQASQVVAPPPPPPPPPSSVPPSNERSSLLSSIRDPANMKRLKKVKK